jgi:hypothetical protein
VDDSRRRELGADTGGAERSDGVLALDPDVEQPGLEGDADGQAGEDQRGRPARMNATELRLNSP